MTKAAVGLGTLGLGATAAVATPFAIKSNGNSNREKIENISLDINWNGSKIPALSTSKEIKNKYKEIECLKEFEEESWKGDVKENESPSLSFSNNNSKGCLTIEHYKWTKGDKWWGGFRLVWSLSSDSERLVISFNVKTSLSSLMPNTSIYIMKKKGDSWSLSYQKEDVNQIITNNSNLEKTFPKPKQSILTDKSKDYWGFNPDVAKICSDSECPKNEKNLGIVTSLTWKWTGNSDGDNTVSDWCENFDNWFGGFFSGWSRVSNELKILKELKGTWTQEN